MELTRLTTEYSETEDRIRLTGEAPSGQIVVIWLTRRLLERLLPPLCNWLEGPGHDPNLQEMAQAAAIQALPAQPPVPAQQASEQALIQAVDINFGADRLRLLFKADKQTFTFGLSRQGLRQWLDLLHNQLTPAHWHLTVWPSWLQSDSLSPNQQKTKRLLH